MGMFDDILGDVSDILGGNDIFDNQDDSMDAPPVRKTLKISEVEKSCNIWNAKDDGNSWKTDGGVWDTGRSQNQGCISQDDGCDCGGDCDCDDDDDDDDDFEVEDDD